jgi:predicted nucleotidyltransferase
MNHSDVLHGKRNALEALCRQYRVQRLTLFGSSVRQDFVPGHSDLDFMVEFAPLDPGERADAYFGLLFGLEELLDSPIDLVESRAIRNPYVQRTIQQHQETVYAVA